MSAVGAVLEWFGFGAPKTAGALRSASPAMNLWVIGAEATARPAGAHALKPGAFNSPIFSPDGKTIFALHADVLTAVPIEHADQSRELTLTLPVAGDHPAHLVGWSRQVPAKLGLLTAGNHLIGIDPLTGACSEVGTGPLDLPAVRALYAAAGICKDRMVYDALQMNTVQHERTDVFVRPVDDIMGRNVTASWPGSVHGEPRFSTDCKRIVFVSDER